MDITKCTNNECKFKNTCLRFIAPASIMQSYSKFEPVKNKCDFYIKIHKNNGN